MLTRKTKYYEEFSDFVYYLFEQHTGARYGFFSVEETVSIKSTEPVEIDVGQENPLAVDPNPDNVKNMRPDIVFVPFCPESITNSLSQYKKYIKNISNLVDSEKFIYLCSLKNAMFYRSGEKKISATPVDEKIIVEELSRNGFVDFDVRTIVTKENKKSRRYKDTIYVWARKK
ncbi:MAG: hypothetical protein HYV41_01840 [Candidatus Magasanikbacteria bacterium]|nr:hypothetical protein [Candidatus Magasanikbacteria bacterium]